jgi:DNA-binding IclR family transcriptional regulator
MPTARGDSPPTKRVVAVLNAFVEEPGARFTLSELATRLAMPKSTCFAVLRALAESGYVARGVTDSTYGLGPAIFGLGRAAYAGVASLDLAHREMDRLTDRFHLPCTTSTLIGDSVIVLERTGATRRVDAAIVEGQRYPYLPPWGTFFAIWNDRATVERWLESGPDGHISLEGVHGLADSAHRTGYLVERFSEAATRAYSLLAGLGGGGSAIVSPRILDIVNSVTIDFADRYYLIDRDSHTREPDRVLPVGSISSASYDGTGHPHLVLSILVMGEVSPATIASYGEAVCRASAVVTEAIGGRDPWAALRS